MSTAVVQLPRVINAYVNKLACDLANEAGITVTRLTNAKKHKTRVIVATRCRFVREIQANLRYRLDKNQKRVIRFTHEVEGDNDWKPPSYNVVASIIGADHTAILYMMRQGKLAATEQPAKNPVPVITQQQLSHTAPTTGVCADEGPREKSPWWAKRLL